MILPGRGTWDANSERGADPEWMVEPELERSSMRTSPISRLDPKAGDLECRLPSADPCRRPCGGARFAALVLVEESHHEFEHGCIRRRRRVSAKRRRRKPG